jgi:hypothetical protein
MRPLLSRPRHQNSFKKEYIDLDSFLECANCKNSTVCPKGAIVQQTIVMPRLIRQVFSNVVERSPNTGLAGRGTEEMKTNDITNRFPPGTVGVAVELGRPSTGTSFEDVETLAKIVCAHGAKLEADNPSSIVFEDGDTGVVKKEFKNERALSFIIEALIKPEELVPLLDDLKAAEKSVDTVFCVDVITRVVDGKFPTDALLEPAGYRRYPNGKTCVGLGRARKEDQI